MCIGQCFKEEIALLCSFFVGDFNIVELESQLCPLHELYTSVVGTETPSIDSIKTYSRYAQSYIGIPCTVTDRH